MRFSFITFVLASLATAAVARARASYDDLAEREFDDVVLDAREVLEDLGMQVRALEEVVLTARRFEELEARISAKEKEEAERKRQEAERKRQEEERKKKEAEERRRKGPSTGAIKPSGVPRKK